MVRAVKKAKRPLKVLVLLHPELMPPDSLKGYSEKEIHVWKTEYDVVWRRLARWVPRWRAHSLSRPWVYSALLRSAHSAPPPLLSERLPPDTR